MAEELYDVLDEEGNKTGQVLPKSVVHERQLWHASAFVWIYNDKSEILFQFRAADKKSFPNKWDVSVAGHVSAGDTPLQTIVREVEEEIGVKISSREPKKLAVLREINPWLPDKKHPEFGHVYIMRKNIQLKDMKIQEKELTDLKWIPVAELETALKDPHFTDTYSGHSHKMFELAINEVKRSLKQ